MKILDTIKKIFDNNSSKSITTNNQNTATIQQNSGTNKSTTGVTSHRYHGRWYGLMLCLGEQSGRDMKEKCKDKASEVLTMLELSNEFPNDFAYVNKIMALQDEKGKNETITKEEQQAEYILGALEAKKVYLNGKNWEKLLVDSDIS